MSKSERTAKEYARRVKKPVKENRIAIEDMVSESYVTVVKQFHFKNNVCVCVHYAASAHGSAVMD